MASTTRQSQPVDRGARSAGIRRRLADEPLDEEAAATIELRTDDGDRSTGGAQSLSDDRPSRDEEFSESRADADSADFETAVAKKPQPRRRWAAVAAAALVAVAVGIAYYVYSCGFESTDDAFIDGHVVQVSPRVAGHVSKVYVSDNQWVNEGDLLAELDPADFTARLAAAEAVLAAAKASHTTRSLGADVAEVTFSAAVLDASAAVAGAEAKVETARAAVMTAKSNLAQAQAQAVAAKAALKQSQADLPAAEARQQRAAAFLARIQALVPEHAAAKDTLDEAVSAEHIATADVTAKREAIDARQAALQQAGAAVAAAESGVRQAEADVTAQLAALERAKAQLASAKSAPQQVAESRSQRDVAAADIVRAQAEAEQARLNLSYTKIRAPFAGHVTRKSVEVGACVQTGQPLLALVETHLWVVANFKETQLDHMKPGQPVNVTIDAYPGVQFAAHVDSVQRGSGAWFSLLPPENATGNFVKVVQRVPVKIEFDDLRQLEHYAIGPGMSVVPTVRLTTPAGTTEMAAR